MIKQNKTIKGMIFLVLTMFMISSVFAFYSLDNFKGDDDLKTKDDEICYTLSYSSKDGNIDTKNLIKQYDYECLFLNTRKKVITLEDKIKTLEDRIKQLEDIIYFNTKGINTEQTKEPKNWWEFWK
jgi:hypothetical protein